MPAWRKPVSRLVRVVHAAPEAEAFDGQRDFPGIAPHGAAPAPVAAGLLAADAAFLAQHDRMAFLGQEQRGGGADDAAADDHHAGAGRKTFIRLHEIDGGRHDVAIQHIWCGGLTTDHSTLESCAQWPGVSASILAAPLPMSACSTRTPAGWRCGRSPPRPDDPSRGIAQGVAEAIEQVDAVPAAIGYFGHGTTVATNALIQHRGVKTGLITTDGFRDLLEIGRQKRPDLYDLQADKPPVLVSRESATGGAGARAP